MADNDWKVLETADIKLGPSEEVIGGWKVLKSADVAVSPSEEEIGGWKVLQTADVLAEPSEEVIGGWNVLKSADVTVSPPSIFCEIDADCPLGYVCVDGKCVKKKEPTMPISLGWLLAGGLGLGALILLAPKKRKVVKVKT